MLMAPEIQVFLLAAETENFSEVARRLGISQPAVSMRIKALEEALGAPLFQRTGRSVTLTEAGETLVPMARDLANRTIHIEEAMASIHGDVAGRLRVACTTTAGKYVLPHLMARLVESHPRVTVECLVVRRPEAIDLLREGHAHLGVASMRTEEKDLEYRAFLTDRIVLIACPDHPWAERGEPIDPEELPGERFIVREETSGTHVALQEALSWHDLAVEDLHPQITLGNAEAIRMTVQEGIGVAFVSWMVAKEAVERGSLAMIPVAGLALSKTLYLIRNPDRPATRAQTAFWDLATAPETEDIRSISEYLTT
jgi:DNA-binding transcriptional LysR family regulator